MKLFTLSILALLITVISFSQTAITYKNNSLSAGDQSTAQEIKYVLPGNSGPNQIWDFSKIQFTGTPDQSTVSSVPSRTLNGVSAFNTIMKESDYEYYFNITSTLFEEKGYTTKDVSLTYSDPIIKMKYPFSYGDQFTDKYAGTAMVKNETKIDVTGDYSVSADAYGTLFLPDRVLKNTLRIRTEKNSIQVNPCNSIESQTIRFLWYAPQYRYPVLIIATTENKSSGQEPTVTRSAYVNLQQPLNTDQGSGVTDTQVVPDNSNVSVVVYPNPFTEKLSYNYFLRTDLQVTLDLFDMTGRLCRHVIKTQVQSEGLHSGVLYPDEIGLSPGIYYLRFTFDHKVVISKIIKI